MKRFFAVFMMILCIGAVGLFAGCGPKNPDTPQDPDVYALNNIEVYATLGVNSSVTRFQLHGLTTRVYSDEMIYDVPVTHIISDLDFARSQTIYNGISLIETHNSVTNVWSSEDYPTKLEVGRNEYNRFEKGIQIRMSINMDCMYECNKPYYLTLGYAAVFDVNIDTNENTYDKTVTLHRFDDYDFSIMADLRFVKI